jgi:integrase
MAQGKYRIKKHLGVYGYNSSTRRVNGKPDVCYYIVFTVDGKNTTEKIGWQSEGYTPQIAAEERAKRLRGARHLGEVKTAKDVRLEQLKINRPLREIKDHYFNSTRGMALKSKKHDLSRWKHHLSFLEEKNVKKISTNDIERIKMAMTTKDLKPATIDHALRLLSRVINHGIKHSLCPPLSFKIERPEFDNITTEYLSPDEASRLLDTLNRWPRQDIARLIKLAMFSGLRRGELFRLKKEHLDFQHGLMNLDNPKGGKNVAVPMSPPVREILEQQLTFLVAEQDRRNKRYRNTTRPPPLWTDHDFVFPGVSGEQRNECTAIDRIKKKADLPKNFRPFHGLRHHFAVLLASSGEFNLDQIGQLLTHKSSDVTRRYAHFLPEAQQRASDRAAEIIANQATQATIHDKKGDLV